MIVPWVNDLHPYGVSKIPVPDTLVDLVRIKDLKMAVRDNYFAFTLDPEFIMKANSNERRHLAVRSTASLFSDNLVLQQLQQIIQNLFLQN